MAVSGKIVAMFVFVDIDPVLKPYQVGHRQRRQCKPNMSMAWSSVCTMKMCQLQ